MLCQFTSCATNPYVPPPQTAITSVARHCPKPQSAPGDLSKEPNYRQVTVTAETRDGQPAARLTAKDLTLYQGDKQLPITFFERQPVTVGILVDNSGSMLPKLRQTRDAMAGFIRDLNPNDEVFVFAFSDHPLMVAPLSTDHAAASASLATMKAFGRTALYDVIREGLRTLAQGCHQHKVLVVLTDGIDNASTSRFEQVTNDAKNMKVPIYSVGIGDPNLPNLYSIIGGTPPDLERVDIKALDQLAEDTGGRAYLVAMGGKDDSLKRAVLDIANRIGDQYIVGFAADGSINNPRVETSLKGLTLKIKSSGSKKKPTSA